LPIVATDYIQKVCSTKTVDNQEQLMHNIQNHP